MQLFLTNLRRLGDIYLCLIVGIALAIYAATLGQAAVLASPQAAYLLLGLGLMTIPGYSLSILLGLEQYGTATLAGSAIALSFATLAALSTVVWIMSQQFSPQALHALVAVCIIVVSLAAMLLRKRDLLQKEAAAPRWTTIGMFLALFGVVALSMSSLLPSSPTANYTEFSMVAGAAVPTVAVVNREARQQEYTLVLESAAGAQRLASIDLPAGGRWEQPLSGKVPASGQVRLVLYRAGDPTPYRTLWLDA